MDRLHVENLVLSGLVKRAKGRSRSTMENHTKTSVAVDDTHLLVAILPASLQTALNDMKLEQLIEVVMDLGRPPEARFPDSVVKISTHPINHDDLAHTLALIGEFTEDNRADIKGPCIVFRPSGIVRARSSV